MPVLHTDNNVPVQCYFQKSIKQRENLLQSFEQLFSVWIEKNAIQKLTSPSLNTLANREMKLYSNKKI